MATDKILIEHNGPVTTLIINRPKSKNALDNEAGGQIARDYLARRGVSAEAVKLFRLGYFDRALDRYSAALARYGMASPHGRAVTLDNMAAVHRDSGRLDSALRLADLALTVATDAADHRTRGVVFNTLGGIWLAAGRVDRAAECHLHALRLSRDTGHSVCEIDAHLGLAAVRRAQALAADAGTHGRQALELSERAGNAIARVRALTVLARIDLDRGAVRASAERARHAVAQAHAAGYRLGLARALDTLADVLDAAGAPAAAADRRRAGTGRPGSQFPRSPFLMTRTTRITISIVTLPPSGGCDGPSFPVGCTTVGVPVCPPWSPVPW